MVTSVHGRTRPFGKMASMRRFAVLLLALFLMISSVGCIVDEPLLESDLNFVSVDGYSIYTVVYSETTATEELIGVARQLRDTLELVLGCEVALTDDHVSLGTDYSYEILVGDVNRTATASVLPNLEEDEYTVRVEGHKILLLGEDNRASACAVEHFINDVLEYHGEEEIKANPYLTISQSYRYNAIHTPPDVATLGQESVLPVSPYLPTELLIIPMPEKTQDALMLATLQGLAASMSGEQILIQTEKIQGEVDNLSAPEPDGYGATLYARDAQGEPWTVQSILNYFAPRLQGYILCSDDLSSEAAAVAVSLANQLKAVVLTESNRAMGELAGLSCVFDATTASYAWLYESQYFNGINRKVAVEQSAALAPRLIDYAVMTGALLVYYAEDDPYLHAQAFRYLDDGAIVLGENDTLGKYRSVQTLSAVNASYVPARQLCNLSTLSGFSRDGLSLAAVSAAKAEERDPAATEEGVHTVTLVMTDGESLEWLIHDCVSDARWYHSDLRGSFAINWGIPATLRDLAHPVLQKIASRRTEKDEFVVQLSGLGYSFPSLWAPEALAEMSQQLGGVMQSMGVSYLQICDIGRADVAALTPLASQEAVKGMVYTDASYEYLDGTILWVEDVPIVSASYRLWAGLHEGSIEYVAESLNGASTDPKKETAYSVVMVHAWSGLDSTGRLVSEGDTMAAVAALISALDDNVEVVGAQEFFARIQQNLSPAGE